MDTIQKLTELFKKFPGIGPRQAKRFVYFLLSQPDGYNAELTKLVAELKNEISCCDTCYRFFPKDRVSTQTCVTCRDTQRNSETLMIVSRDVDFESIEKSKSYTGFYFILGGSLPILEVEPQKKIRQRELLSIVEKKSQAGLKEIILALDYNPEGENTRDYLVEIMRPLVTHYNLKISSLGRGMSTGSELEYTDADTIKNALSNRK